MPFDWVPSSPYREKLDMTESSSNVSQKRIRFTQKSSKFNQVRCLYILKPHYIEIISNKITLRFRMNFSWNPGHTIQLTASVANLAWIRSDMAELVVLPSWCILYLHSRISCKLYLVCFIMFSFCNLIQSPFKVLWKNSLKLSKNFFEKIN